MDQNLITLLGESIEPYQADTPKPSVICCAPVPNVPTLFNILEPLSYDPVSANARKYQLVTGDYRSLCSYIKRPDKLPHFELGLRSDEACIIYKIKVRPVVVLTWPLTEEAKGCPSHFKNCLLCAPLFTLVDKDNFLKPTYNPKTIDEIIALKYRSFFPLPTHPYLESRISGLRLDRIQPTRIECLSKPIAKVTDNWFAFIWEWIHFYVTGKLIDDNRLAEKVEIGKTLNAAREVFLEALSKKQAQ
jgi:hypothetical protein